ncbi:RNase H family protein [Paenibacillus sp. UNC496MF]|uniref:RNase H family protein n=1 Tax=Paenibacillus sp. UNC496MF TaxID=1502753 RepID=UPI000B82ADBC|nr:RNase H family protein [Paenibacillus sp. UNC496MF]
MPEGKLGFDKLRVEMWVSGTAGEDGAGGYCAHLHSVLDGQKYTKTIAGFGNGVTPTRMTLKAVLEGLKQIKNKCFIHIYTGIPQVSAGMNKHIHRWAKKDFKGASGQDLQHEDLWRQIHFLLEERVMSYKVHYLGDSPKPDNNIMVIHTASQYAQKARKNFMEVSIG